jgi:endonuclease/exonuclease/phosphatase family metal-dependent hydrolase
VDLRLLLAKGAGYDYFVGRHDSMRIVTWNLNHRARRRDIPGDVGEVIASLKPDLIVLTEYVSGLSEPRFLAQLKLAGMSQVTISEFTPSQNQILVASHMRLVDRRLRPPDIDVALPSNIVHVGVPDSDLEVVGLRIPDYSRMPRVRRQCWDWVEKVAAAWLPHPSILIGDFNTDPGYSKARCGPRIATMVDAGWSLAAPESGSSYWTLFGLGKRLDHAFVSPHFKVLAAEYAKEVNGFRLARGRGALSDHAALVVDISRK